MRDTARTILERAPLLPRGLVYALGVGAAFGLGVVVAGGIGTAHGTVPTSADNVLARAEARSKSLDDKRAALKLTYAAELQKTDPLHTEPLRAPSTKAHVDRAAEKAAHAETASAPPLLEPPPAPIVEAAPVPVAPRAVEPEPVAAPEKVDDARIEQALAKVLAEHHDAAPAAVDPPPAARTFSLQVASSPTRAGAESVAKKLGGGARVVEGEVGGKPVFRVRLGSFAERAQAEAHKAKLTMPSFIVAE